MMIGGFPQSFFFPYNELDTGQLKPGEIGEITIKVEVMSTSKEGVELMKHGKVEVTRAFGEMSLDELKNRIGTVDETELPMNKEDSQENDSNE